MDKRLVVDKKFYVMDFDFEMNRFKLTSKKHGKTVLNGSITSNIHTLESCEMVNSIIDVTTSTVSDIIVVECKVKSDVWQEKKIVYVCRPDKVVSTVLVKGAGQRILDIEYFKDAEGTINHTQYQQTYIPRFDWHEPKVIIDSQQNDSLSCQQWLSPPPFAVALLDDSEAIYCGVAPRIGAYNFMSLDYVGEGGPSFRLTYEGHTVVDEQFEAPDLIIGFGEKSDNDAIEAYVRYMRSEGYLKKDITDKPIPDWWKEPIFCSWGQMRYDYREDHDGHENGTFINVTNYSTEAIHRDYMKTFEEKGIQPGTVIIDMGWAKNPPYAEPSPKRWMNMRAFIDEQHQKGIKVLLWYTPVVTQGLPIEACMTLEGKAVAPDPTSPVYQQILAEEIRKMLSSEEGCLNADGFKIDFTQCTPSESGRFTSYLESFWALINEDVEKFMYKPLSKRRELIKTHGNKWGVEILKGYIELMYQAMKSVKEDAVLMTHTANPYFAEVVDILRLNDLDGECEDVLGVMTNRARISKMCSQSWLIDTDNDLMIDKKRWRDYIQLQPALGIPDTYYIKSIATSGERFDDEDYELLKSVWESYRNSL